MQHMHLCNRHLQAETAWKGRNASSKLWDTSFSSLQVHRNSREWKNTPKGHHSPVQIVDYPFHPGWNDFIKGMSVLKHSRKHETVPKVWLVVRRVGTKCSHGHRDSPEKAPGLLCRMCQTSSWLRLVVSEAALFQHCRWCRALSTMVRPRNRAQRWQP